MIINCKIVSDIEIKELKDLKKLKPIMENNNLKVNKSAIARELGVDRRTVDKYLKGYEKTNKRRRKQLLDEYYDTIKELFEDENRVFVYRRVLWQYLHDNYGLNCGQSTFRRYINKHSEFKSHFKKDTSVSKPSVIRFESDPGQQAQLDWKECMEFVLITGEVIIINIFVLILSYSRFRIYRLSISKTQDILFNFLDDSFEVIGGVPHELLTDNMKTVMDEARTEYSAGKVNERFQQFADDYGFKVRPCIAARPQTKAKVESPMRILDELRAYSGHLSYDGLSEKLRQINDRENNRMHKEYNMIPVLGLKKEKDFLTKLPPDRIRSHYQITTTTVKVNETSMISYKSNQYSVPPEFIGKTVKMQVYDDLLHIYDSTSLIALHKISDKKLNYIEAHYISLAKKTLPFDDDKINEIAKENLKRIGERYQNDK